MLRMTVVMTVMARWKTCFPAAIAVIATKAEPSEDAKVFCILFIHVGIADALYGDDLCNAPGHLHGIFDDLCEKSVSLGDFCAYIFMQK